MAVPVQGTVALRVKRLSLSVYFQLASDLEDSMQQHPCCNTAYTLLFVLSANVFLIKWEIAGPRPAKNCIIFIYLNNLKGGCGENDITPKSSLMLCDFAGHGIQTFLWI